MAKLPGYTGSIDLISGIRQKNNGTFALAEANAIQTRDDGTRLDTELDDIKSSIKNTEYLQNTFSPTIKNTVSGGVLAVHDVSTVEHHLSVNVRSKNILPYPYASGSSYTTNGVTFTANDDGSVTLNGTPTTTAVYYMSLKSQITTEGNVYALSLRGSPDINNIYIANNIYGGEHTGEQYSSQGKTYCIFTDKGATGVDCYIVVLVGAGTLENVTVYPQLELGTTATEYTPYVSDLSAVGVSRLGKNLMPTNTLEVQGIGDWTAKQLIKANIPSGVYTFSCEYEFLNENNTTVAAGIRDINENYIVETVGNNRVQLFLKSGRHLYRKIFSIHFMCFTITDISKLLIGIRDYRRTLIGVYR